MAPAPMAGVVFVTLLTGGSYKGIQYVDNVVNWVKQLQCHGVPNASILLLVADSASSKENAAVSGLGVPLRHVPTINTPAGDMGPDALEEAARDLASDFGAGCDVIAGDELLERNFPLIHAVGRAAAAAPRLIELTWGTDGPAVTLVGKGVCFDTGGLNIKPGASMGLMKKDMGGAAHALALAHMIMGNDLPVHLVVYLAIAENAISSNAYRPGDILISRAGLTVEIDNTDAEGRLVLGDALARAAEDDPALIIDFATLTGAARVALGPASHRGPVRVPHADLAVRVDRDDVVGRAELAVDAGLPEVPGPLLAQDLDPVGAGVVRRDLHEGGEGSAPEPRIGGPRRAQHGVRGIHGNLSETSKLLRCGNGDLGDLTAEGATQSGL